VERQSVRRRHRIRGGALLSVVWLNHHMTDPLQLAF